MKKFLSLCLVALMPLLSPHSYGQPRSTTILPETKLIKILWVDESFSEKEKLLIIKATEDWQTSTKNIVKFVMVKDKNAAQKEYATLSKDLDTEIDLVNIEKISQYDLITYLLDGTLKGDTLGFYNERSIPPSILLVTDRFESNQEFKNVTMHELGHSLGLEHIKMPFTLMYPTEERGADCLTLEDLEEFCRLYNCDAWDLNWCEP